MVKNEGNISSLSLKKNLKIAVIGPSFDNQVNFFAGYSSVISASTKSSDFNKSEEDNMVKMDYNGAITKHKEVLLEFRIIFDDQLTPKQKEIIMAIIKQNLSSAISSPDKDYITAEEFIEKYYTNCKSVKEVME